MMTPAVASCWITRYAPIPSTPDCNIMRKILERAMSPPVTSLAPLLVRHVPPIGIVPAITHLGGHAECDKKLGIAPARLGK